MRISDWSSDVCSSDLLTMAARWYIVHVYSNFEKKVAQAIRDAAAQKGLSDLFEEVLVPTEDVVEVRRGQQGNAERTFFPGYVLATREMLEETYHTVTKPPKVADGKCVA